MFNERADVPVKRLKDATNGHVVVDLQARENNLYQTRLTVGDNCSVYLKAYDTPMVNLLIIKLLHNSTVSTQGATFMTIDIKDVYLNTPMDRFEYRKLKLDNMPEDFVARYNLGSKADKHNQVYVEIRRGMHGLPQAGLLT